jgi:hypothetical protein
MMTVETIRAVANQASKPYLRPANRQWPMMRNDSSQAVPKNLSPQTELASPDLSELEHVPLSVHLAYNGDDHVQGRARVAVWRVMLRLTGEGSLSILCWRRFGHNPVQKTRSCGLERGIRFWSIFAFTSGGEAAISATGKVRLDVLRERPPSSDSARSEAGGAGLLS